MRKRNEAWDDRPAFPLPPLADVFDPDPWFDYWQQRQEELGRWRQKMRTKIEGRIEFLRHCETTPRVELDDIWRSKGRRAWLRRGWYVESQMGTCECVYMLWCPNHHLYKIGHTQNLRRRIRKHWRSKLGWQTQFRIALYTPVRRELEKYLHRHFSYYHRPSPDSDELFDLPQIEADGFTATADAIERHLLSIEIRRMEAHLPRVEAEEGLTESEEAGREAASS